MKLAGDPNKPVRIKDDAALEELRAKMMKHLGILIEGGLIDLEALPAEKRRTANTILIEGARSASVAART
jgi:hypothetical protein